MPETLLVVGLKQKTRLGELAAAFVCETVVWKVKNSFGTRSCLTWD